MNKYEERVINESVEVKQVVIGIMDLHSRKRIEQPRHNGRVDLIEIAKEYVKRQLLDSVEKYIKVIVNRDERFVEGVIFMPYVQDEVIDGFKSAAKASERAYSNLREYNLELMDRIQYLEKPWYKKAFLAVKRHFK